MIWIINILRKLDHPNILKITDFYNLKNEYNIITEYCQEGELFDEIKAQQIKKKIHLKTRKKTKKMTQKW